MVQDSRLKVRGVESTCFEVNTYELFQPAQLCLGHDDEYAERTIDVYDVVLSCDAEQPAEAAQMEST